MKKKKKETSIRKNLKNMEIKLYHLADWLKISKPTLYKYIDMYEIGEIIPEKYLSIFESIISENKGKVYDRIKSLRTQIIFEEAYNWNPYCGAEEMIEQELKKEIEHDFERRLLLSEFYETIDLLKKLNKNELGIFKNQIEAYLNFKKK